MGSIGNKTATTTATATAETNIYDWGANGREYDIEDFAEQFGYDSAEEMVYADLARRNDFWTTDEDMVASTQEQGYDVIEQPNGEYFVVVDQKDVTETEFLVYYNTAGSSRTITRVKKS